MSGFHSFNKRSFSGFRLGAVVVLVGVALLGLFASGGNVRAAGNSRYFPETNQSVGDPFLTYWETHGGLAIFGYPISDAQNETDPISGKTYLTQWFERERFELHPEFAGTPYEVELGLLGRQVTQGREREAPFHPIAPFPDNNDHLYFSATGHSLSLGFKYFWQSNGGLANFGFPLTEEFQVKSPSDGRFYTVQYFERARFEYHPEFAGTPYETELGLLGNELRSNDRVFPIIRITTHNRTSTIFPNQTTVIDDPTPISVSIQYNQPIDHQDFSAQILQTTVPANWQFGPAPSPTTSTYNFTLSPGSNSANYFRVGVTQGPGKPLLVFGIQVFVNNGTTKLPALKENWSDPVALINSYYNAILRREYLRAYNYWFTYSPTPFTPSGLAPFNDFAAGYANTGFVTVLTGTTQGQGAAGSTYTSVPVAVSADQLDGTAQNFYGCYVVRGINVPIGDTVPPYPYFIYFAKILPAASNADLNALLTQANAFVQNGQCTQ